MEAKFTWRLSLLGDQVCLETKFWYISQCKTWRLSLLGDQVCLETKFWCKIIWYKFITLLFQYFTLIIMRSPKHLYLINFIQFNYTLALNLPNLNLLSPNYKVLLINEIWGITTKPNYSQLQIYITKTK